MDHYRDQKKSFQMLDGTFGGGGHSIKLLKEAADLNHNLKVLGTDLDLPILEKCRQEYAELINKRKLALVHSNFAYTNHINVAKEFNRKTTTRPLFDICLLDLGFSSY